MLGVHLTGDSIEPSRVSRMKRQATAGSFIASRRAVLQLLQPTTPLLPVPGLTNVIAIEGRTASREYRLPFGHSRTVTETVAR
jgi:hypothetical protein